jgi:PAS domain S-box-containing protein
MVLDLVTIQALQRMLTKQLTARLYEEAAHDRTLFDQHIKQQARAAKLLAMNQRLVLWLEDINKNEQRTEIRYFPKMRPPWFPPISAWRGIISPRYVMLSDSQGRLQEVYLLRDQTLPAGFFIDRLLVVRSQNQGYLTLLNGKPYLLASAAISDAQGEIQGMLTLITLLDNQFLTKLNYATIQNGAILALLVGTNKTVVASSAPTRVSAGLLLNSLLDDYLTTGEEFFDYGASDLRLQLTTLMPKTRLVEINESVLALARKEHIIAAAVFVVVFTIIVIYLSRRIDGLIRIVDAFSQNALGSKQALPKGGDQLIHLEKRISLLTEEILAARKSMHLRSEMRHKAKQLRALDAVTRELEVGVLLFYGEGKEQALNQRASEFEKEYGEKWDSVRRIGSRGEVKLQDRKHRHHILRVSRLTLFEVDDVLLVQDVTEQRQAVKIVQESEERFRNITQAASDAITSIDTRGEVISWNRAATKMFGYSDSEMLGQPLTKLMPPRYRAAHRAGLARILCGEKPYVTENTLEMEGLPKNGTCFPIELSLSTWKMQGAQYFTGIIRDITDRKRSEKVLLRERDFAESLIETAQVIILVLDPEGRIVRFNNFMERLSGYRLEEVRGKDWFATFLPRRDRLRIKEVFSKAMSNAPTKGNINRIVTRDGHERDIEWWDRTLKDGDDHTVGLIVIGQDITERKEKEAQLLQAQKMEAVGQLTGSIAHDFNNLLTIILGNLGLLAKQTGETGDPDIREYVADALSAAREGADLTHRLLALSRKQFLEPRNININKIVDNHVRLLRRLLGERIKLSVNMHEEAAMVCVDTAQIESTLLNLAINARDAMPEGGTLTVDVTRQHIEADNTTFLDLTPGSYVMITVTDSGIGMSAETLSHVVEPFFTTKQVGKGTGLGLSMAYSFTKRSGGGLRINSTLGKGTTVSVVLPETGPTNEVAVMEEGVTGLPGGSETILLVEDEPRVRKLVKRRMQELGYQIVEAENATAAKAFLAAGTPVNLLFSDIIMPDGISGIELANWTMSNRPAVRILLTTAANHQVNGEEQRDQNGNFPLLRKPYDDKTLAQTIRVLLDE